MAKPGQNPIALRSRARPRPGCRSPRAAVVLTGVEPEHGPQHPGQAGVAEQQGPLADDEPFGYVRVPAVEHGGGHPSQHGLPVQERGRHGAIEAIEVDPAADAQFWDDIAADGD